MKKINRIELVAALDVVKQAVAAKELIEQSTCFAFDGTAIRSYNDEVAITYPFEFPIVGAVDAVRFYGLLTKLTNEELIVVEDEETLLIRGKKGVKFKSTIALQKEIRIPEIDMTSIKWRKWTISDELLKTAAKYTASDFSQPLLTCIHCGGGFIESTDNYRCFRIENTETIKLKEAILVPAKQLAVITAINPTKYAVSGEWLHFTNEIGVVVSCRTFGEGFPDTSGILDIDNVVCRFDIDTHLLQDTLDRAGVFSKTEFEEDELINILLEDNVLHIIAVNQTGSYEEYIKFDYNGKPLQVQLNPEVFRRVGDVKIKCEVGENRIKLKHGDWSVVAAIN